MLVGVPREIKSYESRVAMVPAGVEQLVTQGHQVLVEQGAGVQSGYPDEAYTRVGARIAPSAKDVWQKAEMIVKVKEPLAAEYPLLRPGQIVFTYFHFAASEELTRAVLKSGCVAVAYETVQLPNRELPLLTPMSEVAGRMAIQEGARFLESRMGGSGILLGGVPGVFPAYVTILGGGVVGTNSAKMAAGLGADVVILDINLDRLRYLDDIMPPNVRTLMSTPEYVRQVVARSDLVVGAVLIPGGRAPWLVTRDMLKLMKPRSVIVDVAVDQGGCVETSRPTTHEDPVYEVDGIIHYCVANMPGAVPRTSTIALTNATLPYVLRLAADGWRSAARQPDLALGINMVNGKVTYEAVARAFGLSYTPLREAMAAA
jgi:alanine dehydrogenase